ncbi:MAG: hypothetical protein ABIG95_01930 [Candidatus Woesearchaeota archaeon]
MISLLEIFDMAIMTAFVGYIFSDIFQAHDPFAKRGFNWQSFKFAAMVTAPGLLLHELSHKFIAISFGMQATFHAPISIRHLFNPLLIIGDFPAMLTIIVLIMKSMGVGFLFFIPAFVSILGPGTPAQFALIAFAGPAANLLLWLGTDYAYKKRMIPKKHQKLVFLTKEINKFLFIFNMIPIPGFDGSQVLAGLLKTFF